MEELTVRDREILVEKLLAIQAIEVREIDVNLLLSFVNDIVNWATKSGFVEDEEASQNNSRDKPGDLARKVQRVASEGAKSKDEEASQSSTRNEIGDLAPKVRLVSNEITVSCGGYKDVHVKALDLFKELSIYRWDAKVLLVLAAFAVKYGGVTLIDELRSTNQLANAIARILPPQTEPLHSQDVIKLINTMLDMTKCIIDHFKLSPTPDPKQKTSVATSRMIIASYMTIYSVVAMVARISAPSTPDKQKQSDAAESFKSSVIQLGSELARQLNLIKEIGQKHPEKATVNIKVPDNLQMRESGAFRGNLSVCPILQKLFLKDTTTIQANEKMQTKTSQVLPLKAFFKTNKKQLPLFDGSSRKQATFDILKKKNLLLMISDIDFISKEDHSILRKIYDEARQQSEKPASQYDFMVLWLPIMKDSIPMDEKQQKQFQFIQDTELLPWSSVSNPSVLRPEFFKYAKDEWHFDKNPMVVVLDQQGTVVNTNSLHMIRIWGIHSFPFTSLREEQLWKEERLSIEFLLRSIVPTVIEWIGEGKYVCLVGGRDINLLKQIKDKAKEVARVANIQLKMLYLGKSNPGKGVEEIINHPSITSDSDSDSEKLSFEQIKRFWVRLDSMSHSMVKVNKLTENNSKEKENNSKLRQIMLLFEHDYSDQGWAAIGGGVVDQMAEAKGSQMFECLDKFDVWEKRAMQKGFVAALTEQLHQYHYINLMLPGTSTAGNIPELLKCPKCNSQMQKFIGYHCPADEHK